MLLVGCATHPPKRYKIIGEKQNYYTDTYLIQGDSLYFNETDWSNKPVRFFKLHQKEVIITDNRNKQ